MDLNSHMVAGDSETPEGERALVELTTLLRRSLREKEGGADVRR